MKKFLIILICLPYIGFGQFGFQRKFDITTIQNSIQQRYPWVGGLDYCQYSNIDLDQDGTQDLFIFDTTCDKVLTFLQKGAPGTVDFEYAPQYEAIFESISPKLYGWGFICGL